MEAIEKSAGSGAVPDHVGTGFVPSHGEVKKEANPELKEIDRLKLERLNLSISNLNLQLALLNERARALQIEMAGFRAEREGLARGIAEGYKLDGNYRLNPDTLQFESKEIKDEVVR